MQSTEEIYRQYANYVYQYLLSRTHNADISEELTQETFYQAVRSIGKFNGSCKVTTWLCAIANNQLQTYRRKNRQMQSLDREDEDGNRVSILDETASDISAESRVLESMERVNLVKTLHLLKEPYREVLYLRSFGDLSFKEIGEVFGKSENWARVTFYRGKEMLRKELENHEI